MANAPQRRGLRRGLGRGAQDVLARPRAHRGDRAPHQRVQDQRGRRHPARRAWASTPTASSASTSNCRRATSCACSTSSTLRSPSALQRRGGRRFAGRDRRRRRPGRRAPGSGARARRANPRSLAMADRAPRSPARAVARRTRGDRPGRAARVVLREARRRAGSRARIGTGTRRPTPCVFHLLQDRTIRVSWKIEVRAPLAKILHGQALRRAGRALRRDPPPGAAQPGVRRAAHARRRRQRAHQHPGQLRRLPDAQGGRGGGRADHGAGALARRRDLGRARHRHHQARVPDRGRDRRVPRLQAAHRPRRTLQPRQADARRRPAQRLHAELRADGRRVADPAGLGHRRDRRLGQELPALRQVQAGLRHPRAARQPALLAAQQDPRHVVADRGIPVRGADPARRVDPPLGRVLRRRRSLHRVPQVRDAVSGRHRFRRRDDEHAQPAAQDGPQEVQSGQRGGDVLPQRHRPGHDQRHARGDDRRRLPCAALRERTARQVRVGADGASRRPP